MYRPRWGVELRVSRCEVPGPIMPQLIKMITFSESINFSQDKKKKNLKINSAHNTVDQFMEALHQW